MPFGFKQLSIPDVILVKSKKFEDDRGYFRETYKKSSFLEAGIDDIFKQDNFSYSGQNVLRGLHFQTEPNAQGKLVRCLKGEIFDVAVDVRKGSPFYTKWVGKRLDEKNGHMLYIPEGFAHGFLVTGKEAFVSYKVTSEYSPENEVGIIWNDKEIGIDWPAEGKPTLSDRDSKLPRLAQIKNDFLF